MTKQLVAGIVVALALLGAMAANAGERTPVEVTVDELSRETTDFELFMGVRATDEQIAEVRNAILASSEIAAFAYLDKTQAFEEFQRIFADQPDLIKGVDPEKLPTSFRVDIREDGDVKRVIRRLRKLPGVDEIATPTEPPTVAELRRALRELCERYRISLSIDHDFEVFMKVKASQPDIAGVRSLLDASDVVDHYIFLDKQDAFKEFKEIFKKQPNLIKNIDPVSLPTSFRVWLIPDSDPTSLKASLEELSGVDDINTPYVFSEGTAEVCELPTA